MISAGSAVGKAAYASDVRSEGVIISTCGSTTSRGEPVSAAIPVRWMSSVINLATAVLGRRSVRSFRTSAIVRGRSLRVVW
jgi:hypothetical protein